MLLTIDPYNVDSIALRFYNVSIKESLRQDLIRKGLRRATLFSWEKTALEHIKIFEEVINK